jgi:glycogen synthase
LEQNIAFITYETPFAPGGGIAAVISHLPMAVQSASKIPTFVITPFHFNIKKTSQLESEMKILTSFEVTFGQKNIPVDILLLQKEVGWIFIKPHEENPLQYHFFSGQKHPYDLSPDESGNKPSLIKDSLFFGSAASLALKKIFPESDWTILLQDWEAATTTLFLPSSDEDKNIRNYYLTLHNSYDSGINQVILELAGLEKTIPKYDTVLECALPRVKDPIFTVSEQFALDLSSEVFQAEIMVPHIIGDLSERLYGVNNGPFVDLQIPADVYQAGLERDYSPLSTWKDQNRERALQLIDNLSPSKSEPVWGDVTEFMHADFPWFVMAGRDDSRQKGYELACLAVDQFLGEGGKACFIFLPIPGEEGLPGIQFVRDLAVKYPAKILGFPFLFREGYFPTLRAATYGMMPSYYEPFGMANEFFLTGASCIVRATGGIVQQIVPHRKIISFSDAAAEKSNRWHKPDTPPTGFLFREADEVSGRLDDWLILNRADYSIGDIKHDRLNQRKELDLIRSMAEEMRLCIEDAVNLYNSERRLYFESIIHGASFITKNFSWERSARKYLEKISLKI